MSGVSLRLLLAHAALRTSTTRFTGHRQLHQRPNADLLDALEQIGCRIESTPDGRLPIAVTGPASPAAKTTLATGVTSQYLSGLMLSAPGLPEGLTIALEGERMRVEEFDAAVTIHPADTLQPAGFDTYEDHRMAMALSVIASKAGGCVIHGADCVAKTYADYWEDFDRVCGVAESVPGS